MAGMLAAGERAMTGTEGASNSGSAIGPNRNSGVLASGGGGEGYREVVDQDSPTRCSYEALYLLMHLARGCRGLALCVVRFFAFRFPTFGIAAIRVQSACFSRLSNFPSLLVETNKRTLGPVRSVLASGLVLLRGKVRGTGSHFMIFTEQE